MNGFMFPRKCVAVCLVLLAGLVAAMATDQAPQPAAEAESSAKTHRLAPNDLLEVKVFRQPDLETRGRVTDDGTVMLPLLGAVVV